VDQETFARKQTELRDRLANLKLQLDVLDRSSDETAELAAKVFELSQTLRRLDDATLVTTIRKPFDVLAEGLISDLSRGDWI
jgi:site-specific DNA recombinase